MATFAEEGMTAITTVAVAAKKGNDKTLALLIQHGAEVNHVDKTFEEQKILRQMKHYYINVQREEWKLDTLIDLIELCSSLRKLIIYCNTKSKIDWLVPRLQKEKCDAGAYARKSGWGKKYKHLVTHLDITHGRHVDRYHEPFVFNYDLPEQASAYAMGATLRDYGHETNSFVITLVNSEEEERLLIELCKSLRVTAEELPTDFEEKLGIK